MNIVNVTDWDMVPGTNTYFTSRDVAPRLVDGVIRIYNARGVGRSWGQPSVTSRVVSQSDDFVHIHVTGWHKHTISPVGGDYYFVRDADGWSRRMANHRTVKVYLQSRLEATR